MNVVDELTFYEFSVHRAAADVEPFGEDRDDFRAAVNTTRMIMSWVNMSDIEAGELIHALRCYLKCNRDSNTEVAKPEQQRAIIQG